MHVGLESKSSSYWISFFGQYCFPGLCFLLCARRSATAPLLCRETHAPALSAELALGALERFLVNRRRATLAAEADCSGTSCLCSKQIVYSSHLVPEVSVYLSGFPVLLSGPESLWPQTPSSSGLLHLAAHMAATSQVTYLDKAPWERKLCQGRSQLPLWCRKRESG